MKFYVFYFHILIFSLTFSQQNLNMDLVGNLPYPQGTNDIWGYANGANEYALVGTITGFSVVDVTVPSEPIELFFISGSSSTWRDIKTWDRYAYVTTEASDGLLIVDLSDLSGQTYVYTNEFFTTSHNIFIDENGYAYIFGADTGNGGAVILDLNQDPMNPTLAGIFDDYYLHDGMVRGDTLWGSAVYAGVFSVINVSDKSNPTIMSSYPTSCSFTHNAWISDDNNYLFTTDEQSGCNIGAYDVSDIYDISEIDLIQEWTNSGNVIPHNTHVLGDYLVTSYYTSGITIVDASNPYNLIEVAYYDTSPQTSGGTFDGCWGAYPYLPSGLILATDIQNGLFILHTPYGSYEGFGCTDPLADNYDAESMINDGSCIFSGCTDPLAENFSFTANLNDNSCEYFCDDFVINPPLCDELNYIANYGEYVLLDCTGEEVLFFDLDENLISIGGTYVTDPIYEDISFLVMNQEVVESNNSNLGEPEHEGQGENGSYSSTVYNGGLLFNCYSEFILNSIKVYTSYGGERTIELIDEQGNLVNSMIVNIPENSDDGYVIDLAWSIMPGNQYLLTTNNQMNNDNFGDNNPMLKRNTGGLTDYPYSVNNILEITEGYYDDGAGNLGSSIDYYYYFYDWSISYNRTCLSAEEMINITLANSSLDSQNLEKSLIKTIDILGRLTNKSGFSIEVYDDGSMEKRVILK